jgi:hypothetical protein
VRELPWPRTDPTGHASLACACLEQQGHACHVGSCSARYVQMWTGDCCDAVGSGCAFSEGVGRLLLLVALELSFGHSCWVAAWLRQ